MSPEKMGNLSALKDFLAFLATVPGDLSNITAPPFILSPQSLVEYPSFSAERPALFSAPAFEPQAEKRMLLVLQNWLASFQRQYYAGRPVKEGTKKPLNPFLGELFFCEFKDPNGKANLKVIAEQVSHHPPTTAGFISDEENGVRAEAYSTQSTTLSGVTAVIRQSGHMLLTVDKYNETYLLPFPDIYAKGVLTGVPYPELQGTYRIIGSSGYTAEIIFGSKSKKIWSGGDKNSFEAVIFQTGDSKKKPIFDVEGCWSDKWEIRDGEGNVVEKYDLADPNNQAVPGTVRPLEEQGPWESRRAWSSASEGLKNGNFSQALSAKSKLENGQRQLRKKEKAEGKTWETIFFQKREVDSNNLADDPVFGKLIELLGGEQDARQMVGTHGDWRFDPEKMKKWHEGNGPQMPETPLG